MILKLTELLPFTTADQVLDALKKKWPLTEKVRLLSNAELDKAGEKQLKITGDLGTVTENEVKDYLIKYKEIREEIPKMSTNPQPQLNATITEGTKKLQEAMAAILAASSESSQNALGTTATLLEAEKKARLADKEELKQQLAKSIEMIQKEVQASMEEICKLEQKQKEFCEKISVCLSSLSGAFANSIAKLADKR